MKPVQVLGHVDKNGKLELGQLPALPPGEDLRVLIMEAADLAALEKLVDMVASMDIADSELLAQLEDLDEALWDMQFAGSQDVLAKLAKEAYAEHQQGKTVELDLDELNRNDK
jgi:hypothetical protein